MVATFVPVTIPIAAPVPYDAVPVIVEPSISKTGGTIVAEAGSITGPRPITESPAPVDAGAVEPVYAMAAKPGTGFRERSISECGSRGEARRGIMKARATAMKA